MSLYQGRALERAPRRPSGRRRLRPVPLVAALLGALALAFASAHVPWHWVRTHVATVGEVRVQGVRYLDAAHVAVVSGIRPGDDLLGLDLERARQALLLDPRIAAARVSRRWPRDVLVRVVEREPVLLVQHGVPWEVDSSGVLLAPLGRGVVADVPLLSGPDFGRFRAGTQVRTPEVERGLAWVRALGERDLQLGGDVSEVDVADSRTTGILLMSGTRVLAPAWPPGMRELSALRVVLADLQHRGTLAQEVDVRFKGQVIVRPAPAAAPSGHAEAPVAPHSG